jgi:hypothetical protein
MALLRQCLLELRARLGDWEDSERPLPEVAWTKPEQSAGMHGPAAAIRPEAGEARVPSHE